MHKLRNLERKAPKHALAEVLADSYRVVYAEKPRPPNRYNDPAFKGDQTEMYQSSLPLKIAAK